MLTNEKAALAGTSTAQEDNTPDKNNNCLINEQRPEVLPVRPDGIPDELKAVPRWMLWRYTWDDKEKRWKKVPFQARSGRFASSVDPSHRASFGDALQAFQAAQMAYALDGRGEPFDGLGFALGDGFHGIDVDDCRTGDEWSPLAQEALAVAPGYAEVSPSGQGLKIITRSNLDRSRTDETKGLEVYTSGRYFTVTGHQLNGHDSLPVETVDLTGFMVRHFGTERTRATGGDIDIPKPPLALTPEQIEAALSACLRVGRLDGYGEWLTVGMALHHQYSGSVDGLDLWDQYSSQAAGYSGFDSLEAKWHSFDASSGNGTTFATVLSWAKDVTPKALPNTPFRFTHCRDLLTGPKASRWLVRKWIEAGSLALIFGESTAGKTFAVLDWACCVATGKPWHGHAVEQGSVFYIAGEGAGGIGKRLAAWGLHHDYDMSKHPLFVSERGAALMDQVEAQNIADTVKALAADHGDPGLIVVDTLHRNMGEGDENSAADVAAFLASVDQIIRLPLGCTILVVHHSGLSNPDRSRGSSSLRAALDAEFSLKIIGDMRVLACTKAKDHEPPAPVTLAANVIELPPPWLDEGEAMTSLVLTPTGVVHRPQQKFTGAALTALNALRKLAGGEAGERVPVDDWRKEFYATHPTENNDARQKAFKRATKALTEARQVLYRDGFAWEEARALAF
jgi:hypothetical protein